MENILIIYLLRRKRKMSKHSGKKVLSLLIAMLMVFTSFPIVNTYAAEDENLGQVSAITESDKAEISKENQSNTVTYNKGITLDWSPANASIGRNKDGWWAGIKMIAPKFDVSVLENATYDSLAYGASSWKEGKSFWTNKDSKDTDAEHYITLWAYVNEENLNNALSANENIETSWRFDWDNDGVIDQTVMTKINPESVTLNKDGKQVYPVIPGKVAAISGENNAVINDKDSSKITVSYENKLELDWSAKDDTIGRTKDGWWTGIKMTAPNLDISVLKNTTYDSLAYGTSSWKENKNFWTNKDSKDTDPEHYITLWAYVNEENLNNALSANENIETSWRFDWNKDGIIDQVVTISIDPSLVVLNKDNKQVYPSADLGSVTGITDSPKIENDKSNSIKVSYDKEVTLQWSQADSTIGRNKDGWWAGIKMTAPKTADLVNAKYKSKAYGASKWITDKKFSQNKDGDDYITLWAYVADQDMLDNATENIITQWGFDWNNDGVYEQYVSFELNPSNIKLDYTNLYSMDKNAPVFDGVNNQDETDVVWVNTPVTISGGVKDFEENYASGIKEIYYAEGEISVGSKPENAKNLDLVDGKFNFEVTDDYEGWYTIICVDNAGNSAAQKVYVRIDNTPPEFSNVTSDIKDWVKGSVKIEGIVSDNLSKVKTVEYSQGKDGKRETADFNPDKGAFSFTIPSDITYSGEYYIYCEDNAGIKSETTVLVNIDNEKCMVVLNPNSNDWTNQPVTVTGSISDNHSGIGNVFYKKLLATEDIKVTPDKDGNFAINLNKDDYQGEYTVYGTDKVGNSSDTVTFRVQMDKTAPVVNTVEAPTEWTNQSVTVNGNVSDNLSGVDKIFYKLVGEESWNKIPADRIKTEDDKSCSYSFEIERQNYNDVVQVYCIDKAGNESEVASSDLYMDIEAPSPVEITYSTPLIEKILNAVTFGFYQTSCEVTLSSTDNLSGIKSFDYSIDDGKTFITIDKESDDFTAKAKSASVTFKIDPQFRDKVTATATDNSGTGNTSVSVTGNKTIVVDKVSPEISVKYFSESGNANFVDSNNETVNSLADAERVYYNNSVTATVTIEEENFFEGQVETIKDKDGNVLEEKTAHEVGILVEKTVGDKTSYIEYLPKTAEGAQPAERKYDSATEVEYIDWDSQENLHTAVIPFENDADYKLTVEYTDYSDNAADVNNDNGNKIENQKKYESKLITIDTIAPEITATYDEPVDTANGMDYYNKENPIGLQITVKEHNFDPAKFVSKISAKNVAKENLTEIEESLAEFCSDSNNWKSVEGKEDTYVISVPLENAEANYVIDYALQDLALNDGVDKSDNAAPKSVTYDEKDPEIEISTSTALAYKVIETITFGFFKPDVKLTLTAKDATSGISNAVISSKALEVDNVRGEFIKEFDILDAEKVEYKDGLQTAVFEYTLSANDYKNGITATAYDYSNNSQSTDNITDENGTYNGIIVDTKDPVISSIKYNEVNKVGDKYYYSPTAAENAVIEFSVDEEYFYETYSSTSELKNDISAIEKAVTVNVTKDDYSGKESEYTNFTKVFDEANKKIIVTIPTKDNDGDYSVELSYSDLSGKSVFIKTETIVIDTTVPVVEISYEDTENENRVGEGYFTGRTATITVEEHNFDKEAFSAAITAKNIAGDTISNTVAEKALIENKWSDNGDTHTLVIPYTDDAIYTFALNSLQDFAKNDYITKEGNQGSIYKNGIETPNTFTVDTTLPTDVEISYSDNISVVEDVLSKLFWFYNPKGNKPCEVTLTTTDMTSGLQYFTYSYDGNDTVVTENTNGGEKQVKGWTQDKNDLSKFTYTFTINPQFRGKVTASATDNAGNVTKNNTVSDKTIVVDNKNAIINAELSKESNIENGIKYYSDDVTVKVNVNEENFMDGEFADEVKDININVFCDGKKLDRTFEINDWSRVNGTDEWQGTFTLGTKDKNRVPDGDYRVTIDYTDKSKNVSKTCTVDNFTIDTTVPIVEISYEDAKNENRVGEGYFTGRTATIIVTEHNFDKEAFSAVITAKNIAGDTIGNTVAEKALNDNKWEDKGDIHTLVIPYTDDAIYTFALNSLQDLAKNDYVTKEGNQGSIYKNGTEAPNAFTVDTKEAEVEILIDNALAYKILKGITFGFFDKTEVQIIVKDATSGLQKLSYESLKILDSKGDATEINLTSTDMAHITCADGKQIAVYKFTIDSEYKDSIKATVYDNSGNVNSTDVIKNAKNEEYNGIITDTTDPVLTNIVYNEINSIVNNNTTKHYYPSDAKITFNVDEEYFFENYYESATEAKLESDNSISVLANDVTLEITKNGQEYYKGSAVPNEENSKLFKPELDETAKTITITIPSVVDKKANDGDFVVKIGYTDLADHYAEITTDTIVIDTTAPEVSIKYDNNEVSENALDNTYFNANRTATITVVEHNFAPEYIKSQITAVDVNGEDVNGEDVTTKAAEDLAGITVKDNWKQDEEDKNKYTYVIEYSDDANYTFALTSAKDYALNEMNPDNDNKVVYAENTVSPENFVVDKVAPSENVKYTITNENDKLLKKVLNILTFGIFFNSKVDIKVETTDITAGLYKAVLSIKDTDGNVIDNLSIDGSGIFALKDDKSKGDTTFTVDVSKLNEFRGKLYIDIYDKAGNLYQNYQVDTINEIVKVDGQITVNNKVVDNDVNVIDNIEQYESIEFHKQVSSIDISYTSAAKSVVNQSSPAKNGAKSLVKEKINSNAVSDKNMCATNVPLFNTNVPVSINVTDKSSGISAIDIFVFDANENREIATYNTVIRNNGKITSSPDKVFKNVQNSEWSLEQDENGLTVSANKNITIKSNYNDIVVLVQLTDNAGNISYDYYQFGIDKTAPVLSAVFNDSSSAQNSVYYSNKRTLTLTVAERDFVNSGKSVEFTYKYQGKPEKYVISANKFRQVNSNIPVYKDNKTYSYTIDIFTNDGEYADFEFLAVDRADNKKSSDKSIIKSANNDMFRYDHIAPVITIVSDEHGRNENTKFYQDSRVITVSVKDRYATNSQNQSYIVSQIANLTDFRFTDSESGKDYHTDDRVLTYVFTFQTNTSIDCNLLFNRIRDLAGNVTRNVPTIANANNFTVDGKAPNNFSATIVEDNHPAVNVLNQSDYKVFVGDNITLTITCEDENLSLANISNAKLICAALTSNGKTKEQSFDIQKISSSGRNKLTYSISNLDYDGFYDLSFTVTDDSGKISSTQNVKFALCRNGALYSKSDIEIIRNHGAFNTNSISEIKFNQYSAEAGTAATLSISSKNGSLGFKSRVLVEGEDYIITGGASRDNALNCYRSIYQLTPKAFMLEDGRILDGVYLITITPNNTESANGQKSEEAQSTSFEVTLDATNPVISNVSTNYKTSYGSEKSYEFSQDDKKTLFTSGIVLNFNISDTFSGINKDTLKVTWGDETESRKVEVSEDGTCSIDLNSADAKNGNVVNISVKDNAGNDIEYSFTLTIDSHFWIYIAIAAFIIIASLVIIILVIKSKKSKKDE